tara:strand:+ start:34375 stop:35337 length:963 start_codon:yes stop_codon:yes gene_type:complete
MTRYLDTVPHPWNYSVIEQAIFENFTDARTAIEDMEGGRLWRSLQELDDSVYVLEMNITDLLDEISLFSDRSKNPAFWRKGDGSEAEHHTREIKRKLSNCTGSLMALVDHARNFKRVSPVPDYAEKLKEYFSSSGLHDFLQCLRNYNTHWRIAQANWIVSYDHEVNSRQARFFVRKADLLAWDGWNTMAEGYIKGVKDAIDIYEVFSTYRGNVQQFYAWHQGAVFSHYNAMLRPYLECKRLYEGINKKNNWNVVISHAPKTLNPLQYLSQYLPSHAVEYVLGLPYKSKQQVDEIIRLLDMDEFCDEALRGKLYALFGVAK